MVKQDCVGSKVVDDEDVGFEMALSAEVVDDEDVVVEVDNAEALGLISGE